MSSHEPLREKLKEKNFSDELKAEVRPQPYVPVAICQSMPSNIHSSQYLCAEMRRDVGLFVTTTISATISDADGSAKRLSVSDRLSTCDCRCSSSTGAVGDALHVRVHAWMDRQASGWTDE
eukprot:GHVU01039051.1.p2 GENE.GHVU01039051.1~~GHVU01039051.1.p2  ORF type:complete len:121 (-),score=15.00 GHVU01039051.1:544-906(-)